MFFLIALHEEEWEVGQRIDGGEEKALRQVQRPVSQAGVCPLDHLTWYEAFVFLAELGLRQFLTLCRHRLL